MFIYSNTRLVRGRPVGFGGMMIDDGIYTLVRSVVWDTENNFFGFRYPTLVITALPDNPDSNENRDGYCESGINEFSAEHAIVYRFSPRDMLATLDYLESDQSDVMPEDDEDKQRFCERFANYALIATHASKPIQGQMYDVVLGFFCEVLRRYQDHENNL